MAIDNHTLSKLDEKAFLGFSVWDFSFRSLSHSYATAFLEEVVLRHPLRTFAGLICYHRLVRSGYKEQAITHLSLRLDKGFHRSVAHANRAFLLAVGFCQKPMRDTRHANGCPAGRFNHRCLYMAQLDLSEPREIPVVCRGCHIKTLATKALLAGVNMHIMTSAMDILHDIFVPSLQQKRFSSGIFCVCPYSVHPIALPLLICGIKGFVVQFNSGYCADYSHWSMADKGIKNERTFISLEAQNRILDFLDGVTQVRADLGKKAYHCFRREGNIYVPE